VLVCLATLGVIAFNWIVATGRSGPTPDLVSNAYPTLLTPANYAFTIWALIYVGVAAFSVYQLRGAAADELQPVRTPYILSCALNCAWLFFWQAGAVGVCLVVMLALLACLVVIVRQVRDVSANGSMLLARAPFGIYCGWITVAAAANFAILLASRGIEPGPLVVSLLILVIAAIGVAARLWARNYFFPLAVAWGLTAIAVRQSGHTLIVVACAVGVVACLIAAVSFVMDLRSTSAEA
jgi:hypothetical protein